LRAGSLFLDGGADLLVISVSRLVALAICEEPTDCSLVAAPISWENL